MFQLSYISEWIAFLCSLLLFSKGVRKEYRIFFFYTLIVVIIEYIGWRRASVGSSNHILFTVVCFFFLLFYLYVTHAFVKLPENKKWIKRFAATFIIFYLINIFFIQKLAEFNSYSFILGYAFLTISCAFYFIEFVSIDKMVVIWKEPKFFIICGFFIYGVLTAMLYIIHRYFAYLNVPRIEFKEISYKTTQVTNGALYLLLALSFIIIWIRRK